MKDERMDQNMPQTDRHRKREIPIEFDFYSDLVQLPMKNRCSIALITNGSALLQVNGHLIEAKSPCILCLSQYDRFEVISSTNLSVKVFHFDPWFIKACQTFENIIKKVPVESSQEHNREMLYYLFIQHQNAYQGYFELSPNQYLRSNEILSIIGAETYSQSDRFWTCRIRRLLLQVLNLIFDLHVDQRKLNFYHSPEENVVSICVNFIRGHYDKELSLTTLCNLVNLNRTSLNMKFNQQLGLSCMEYVMNYRMEMAKEMLSNTRLKVSEISSACGFQYDTYFMKQFQKKCGVTPTQYRKQLLAQK